MARQAVIICGGLGTRLRGVTGDAIPKPMVPVAGRPFMEHVLAHFIRQGVREFVLCTGHLNEHILEHFGTGEFMGAEIEYSVEPEPLGTGGALLNARHLLDERFYLAFGDSFLPLELKHLDRMLEVSGAAGVITVYTNPDGMAPNNVLISPEGRVLAYVKNNPPASMNGLEAGLSLFRRDILDLAPGRVFSLEEEIFPKLINSGALFGVLTTQRFYDIGTPEGLERARRDIHDTGQPFTGQD